MAEETEKIESGDVVQLKSGGPKMTAESHGNSGWHCKWFDGTDLKHGTFFAKSLIKIV
ncbi:DUF2158 domain-containing protein [Mucilaginibacter gossypii]|uniref:YodC family protein n=1 Tax=Mucilaginibacter gossypii TaxID=551996 RepID=UPI000DCDAAE4|nr:MULTISPECIES: DUF2158 domain-containing protein [Mucilaginibacter]QTE37218.1 DUF2158 domain-containing protein [Mucilaginibacter gossypii]RAV57179.1 DUF2158 domain-containing protein [Mucilaginibacter rubeus]